jgi:GNAT superfamily N-acetyltransferase
MNPIIEYFKPGEEDKISDLIRKVYDEFVAGDYTAEGNNFFYSFIEPDKILNRFLLNIDIIITTKIKNKITGMLSIKNLSHISLLFVEKEYHRQGIAKGMIKFYIENIKNKNFKSITVNSSPYSVQIYQKLGFTPISHLLEDHGMKYIKMEMKI